MTGDAPKVVLRLTVVEAIERVTDVLGMYRDYPQYANEALAALVLDELGWPLHDEPAPSPEPVLHRRSSYIMSSVFHGRICLGCDALWPCPDAPADGSDGWDEDATT